MHNEFTGRIISHNCPGCHLNFTYFDLFVGMLKSGSLCSWVFIDNGTENFEIGTEKAVFSKGYPFLWYNCMQYFGVIA